MSDALGRQSEGFVAVKALVAIVLALWLIAVVTLGAKDALGTKPDTPPILFALFQTVPELLFLVAYFGWRSFRKWMGFAFLAVYAQGLLPGVWAWPASLGDITVALAAPWVCLALIRRPAFAASPLFVAWNLFGILDLVVAIVLGGATARGLVGVSQGVTMTPIARLPLALIPGYLVPVFIMLHLASLFQARRTSR